jgi:iron(III) transport system substrate-binding protein
MLSRRTFTLSSLAWAATGCSLGPGLSGARLALPSSHSKLAAAAAKEGTLRIDATTDQRGVQDLLESFKRLYPGIALEYHRPTSSELYAGLLRDAAADHPTADLLISSAMDLQFKLVNDGFAQTYVSPEKPHLPSWAVWKDQVYAVTAEPIGFSYNRALMPAEEIPSSHAEFADLLRHKRDQYRGKIATTDPERSGTSYLYHTQDLLASRDTLDLVEALGQTQPKFYVSGAEITRKIASGEHLLAYNSVLERPSQIPNLGTVFPNDYTLVTSRVALIPKVARHPASAKLFLDFLLSESGQVLLARHRMQPIRTGVAMDGSAPSPDVLRPIRFGPALLANLDEFRRQRVLRDWRHALET